ESHRDHLRQPRTWRDRRAIGSVAREAHLDVLPRRRQLEGLPCLAERAPVREHVCADRLDLYGDLAKDGLERQFDGAAFARAKLQLACRGFITVARCDDAQRDLRADVDSERCSTTE